MPRFRIIYDTNRLVYHVQAEVWVRRFPWLNKKLEWRTIVQHSDYMGYPYESRACFSVRSHAEEFLKAYRYNLKNRGMRVVETYDE